ncbi:nucleoside/nucleotide kinase family protein [Acidimangrovimonas pyrenivorans]|uniref:Nucleoside/nucleotide kinase family protein n=1 Tax=Acidimangrovimonas pyrenivorans TaxID=2030798 RepID=A0ABV7AB63_9RHOB
MTEAVDSVQALAARLLALSAQPRALVALVGAPGSGKSHVAEELAARVNAERPGRAAVLPMDGFHYDDGLLRELGRLAMKGAPDTFDVGGLAATLRRLRGDEDAVAVPVFDRALEISRGAARLIPRRTGLVIVEGNYLLLREGAWAGLAPLFDLTVRLDVPEPVLRARLSARWQGFGLDAAGVRRKLEEVDLPNGRKVAEASAAPDLVLRNG